MAITIDNFGQGAEVSSGTTFSVDVSASAGAFVILIAHEIAGSTATLTLSGGSLTYTSRGLGRSGFDILQSWWAWNDTGHDLSAETVTVTSNVSITNNSHAAFVSFASVDPTTPFDANASLPSYGSNPRTVSTDGDNTLILADYLMNNASGTPDPTFIQILNAEHQIVQYQTYTSPQASVTPLVTNGGFVPAAYADALTAAPTPPPPSTRMLMMTLQQRPHSIGLAPTQAQSPRITTPLSLSSTLSGSANRGSTAMADLTMEDAEGAINNVQTMYVDASQMAFPMILYFPETQQTIFVNEKTQGYYQIAVSQQGQIQATAFSAAGTDSGTVTISIQFLNVPVVTVIWAADGVAT